MFCHGVTAMVFAAAKEIAMDIAMMHISVVGFGNVWHGSNACLDDFSAACHCTQPHGHCNEKMIPVVMLVILAYYDSW